MRFQSALCSALTLLAAAPAATAAVFYVDAALGNDGNDGSAAAPWKTITSAVAQIPGDEHTLAIADGTYDGPGNGEVFPIVPTVDRLTLLGTSTAATIVRTGGLVGFYAFELGLTLDRLRLEGAPASQTPAGDGVSMTHGSILVRRCWVTGFENGVYAYAWVGSGPAGPGTFTRATVERSVLTGNTTAVYGRAMVDRAASNGSYVSINGRNNLVYDNDRGFAGHSGRPDIRHAAVVEGTLWNNVIAFHEDSGVDVETPYNNRFSLTNNLVAWNRLGVDNMTKFCPMTDNVYWANTDGDFVVEWWNESTLNLFVDPQVADSPARDFHLLDGSPCIDAGIFAGALTEDFDGTTRPLDGDGDLIPKWDIGAYESPDKGGGLLRRADFDSTQPPTPPMATAFPFDDLNPRTPVVAVGWLSGKEDPHPDIIGAFPLSLWQVDAAVDIYAVTVPKPGPDAVALHVKE